MIFFLLLACSEQADADGAPPFPDGTASNPVTQPATSIVEVDRIALEDPDAQSPLELLDQDQIEEDQGGEVEAGTPDESGGEAVDGVLLSSEMPYCQPLPGGGPTLVEKWTAEVMAFFGLLALFGERWMAARRPTPDLAEGTTPLPPDEARGILAAQLAHAEAEIAARDRRIALMAEGERRATQQARQEVARTRPRRGLRDEELIATMEAIGQAASASS